MTNFPALSAPSHEDQTQNSLFVQADYVSRKAQLEEWYRAGVHIEIHCANGAYAWRNTQHRLYLPQSPRRYPGYDTPYPSETADGQ